MQRNNPEITIEDYDDKKGDPESIEIRRPNRATQKNVRLGTPKSVGTRKRYQSQR